MYGGWDGSNRFNHLFIVELGRHSVVSVISHEIITVITSHELTNEVWCHCLIIVGGVV